ncbi:MAG: hypothetical protein M9962_06575 [Oligoflexia bacterium]|nr:hypothetical protein [Oligoflexia bacterium]
MENQSPYRQPFTLNTQLTVTVEKEVYELLQVMSKHSKQSVDAMVNISLRRYIATHSDYVPKTEKTKR